MATLTKIVLNADGVMKELNIPVGVDSSELDKKLNLTGGTLTGKLIIKGTAASQPLMVRGIVGSNGNESLEALYLQYGANKEIKLGNSGAYSISANGGSYSGNAKTATKATNDKNGNDITTYLKGLSLSGKVLTYTLGDGTQTTLTIPQTVTQETQPTSPYGHSILFSSYDFLDEGNRNSDGIAYKDINFYYVPSAKTLNVSKINCGSITLNGVERDTWDSGTSSTSDYKLIVGATSTATTNQISVNGNTRINLTKDGTVQDTKLIKGTNGIKVSSDSSGNITITTDLSDEKVGQTVNNLTDSDLPLLFSTAVTTNTGKTYINNNLVFNPKTNTLKVNDIEVNGTSVSTKIKNSISIPKFHVKYNKDYKKLIFYSDHLSAEQLEYFQSQSNLEVNLYRKTIARRKNNSSNPTEKVGMKNNGTSPRYNIKKWVKAQFLGFNNIGEWSSYSLTLPYSGGDIINKYFPSNPIDFTTHTPEIKCFTLFGIDSYVLSFEVDMRKFYRTLIKPKVFVNEASELPEIDYVIQEQESIESQWDMNSRNPDLIKCTCRLMNSYNRHSATSRAIFKFGINLNGTTHYTEEEFQIILPNKDPISKSMYIENGELYYYDMRILIV